MVAICDYLCFLLSRELKHEVFREPIPIALYLFVQTPGGYSVEPCQIRVNHNPLPPNNKNDTSNSLQRNDGSLFLHITYSSLLRFRGAKLGPQPNLCAVCKVPANFAELGIDARVPGLLFANSVD